MAKKRRSSRSNRKPGGGNSRSKKSGGGKPKAASSTVALRQVPGGRAWALVHPRCARDRAEDIEEVQLMIEAGEVDVAMDELRWLLSGCSDCVAAHLLLGELAVNHHNDLELARGHLGYAYQLGLRAWRREGEPTPVPFDQPANRDFHQAGHTLAWCLEKLGKSQMADEIAQVLCKLDPADPLGVRKRLSDMRDGGLTLL